MEQEPPHSRRLRARSARRLLVSSEAHDRDWGATLEHGLLPKARVLTRVPVEHVVVPTTPGGRPSSEARGAVPV